MCVEASLTLPLSSEVRAKIAPMTRSKQTKNNLDLESGKTTR
jgi:hypothetical protein